MQSTAHLLKQDLTKNMQNGLLYCFFLAVFLKVAEKNPFFYSYAALIYYGNNTKMFVCYIVAPTIKVPNQLLGAPLNTDVQLECYVEAFPNTINYWVKSHSEMLLDGSVCSLFYLFDSLACLIPL